MSKEIDNSPTDEPTPDSEVQGLLGPQKVEVTVDLNKTGTSSPASPWWESKLTVTIVAGLFAAIIPATTAVLNYFENEAKRVSQIHEYNLEKERLEEKFFLETTESVIGKLAQPNLSDDAKLALYSFLGDISKEDSGTAIFAKRMIDRTLLLALKKLEEKSEVLEETQNVSFSYSAGDAENDEQNNQAIIAEQKTKKAEQKVKPYITEATKKQIIRLWSDIEEGKRYSIQGKLGTNISFKLYATKPTTFGSFGDKIGVIEDGELFTVEEKDVTLRGYKWLQVKLVDGEKSGWYSWENIRSELVLESQ
jgi:hypothetical protein